ncbi:MAG: hypothetical protein IPO92_10455 [Saprospiraceae bacterium]|nr:hypothetical protein [Saprospiraceae bacterium]
MKTTVIQMHFIHPDHHALAYNPLDQNLIIVMMVAYITVPIMVTWTNITEGLVVSQFYHLAQSKINS